MQLCSPSRAQAQPQLQREAETRAGYGFQSIRTGAEGEYREHELMRHHE